MITDGFSYVGRPANCAAHSCRLCQHVRQAASWGDARLMRRERQAGGLLSFGERLLIRHAICQDAPVRSAERRALHDRAAVAVQRNWC